MASKRCGPTMIAQGPTLDMDSFGGFLPSIWSLLVFFGFVQYRTRIPSLSHFLFDRSREAKRTALQMRGNLSAMSNYITPY